MRVLVKIFPASMLFLLISSPALFSHAQDRLQPRPASCQAPLSYRIGTLDPRFEITREEFRHAVEDAGNVWESDRKIFKYDPKGKLRINLVYDTRQKFTQHAAAVRVGITAKMAEADLIEDRLIPLKENFHALDTSYSDQAASYKRAQDSYNREVKERNLAGGVPEALLQGLTSERQLLQRQFNALEAKRQALNRLTDELNDLIKKRNALLIRANAEANAFNTSAGVQFEEGRYVREGGNEWIDIFQFENKAGLLVILAHELGHARGIKHNANPSSIMSPLIHTDRLALTAEDEDGLKAVCSPR